MKKSLRYYVEEQGDPNAERLLLLHGFTGSVRNWDDVAPALARNFRVVCVDLPGHGQTELPTQAEQCALETAATEIYSVLQKRTQAKVNVLGYSMGARHALFLAMHFPQLVRRLILESGSPGLATEAERAARQASDEALAQRIEQHGIAAFVAEWESLAMWHSQKMLPAEVQSRQHKLRLRNHPHGLALSLRGAGTGVQPSLWAALPNLCVPTLLLAGELDAKFLDIAQQMKARLPDATLKVIEQAGHTTHLEKPTEFVRVVQAFLAR